MPNTLEAVKPDYSASMFDLDALHEHITTHEIAFEGEAYDPVANPKIMEPLHLKNAFDKEIFSDELYFDLLRCMARAPQNIAEGLLRVYVDGLLSPRLDVEALRTKPLPHESFETFLTRVCGGKKFGVVINGVEKWSDPLARLAVQLFQPVARAQGISRTMIEVTLFVGNYGYTPFGIHIDDSYTSVVHLHAGPTTKEMTLFQCDQFHVLNGDSSRCFEPSTLIEHGQTYAIEAGDAFLLPPHYYHVGNTPGYSVGIAFAISKHTDSVMAKKVLQFAIKEKRLLNAYARLGNKCGKDDELISNWLVRARNRYEANTKSLNNLRYKSQSRYDYDVSPHSVWIRDADFPIAFIEETRDLLVYARGSQIRMDPSERALDLVLSLPHEPFSIEQLHRKLNGRISVMAITAFVKQLATAGGLQPFLVGLTSPPLNAQCMANNEVPAT